MPVGPKSCVWLDLLMEHRMFLFAVLLWNICKSRFGPSNFLHFTSIDCELLCEDLFGFLVTRFSRLSSSELDWMSDFIQKMKISINKYISFPGLSFVFRIFQRFNTSSRWWMEFEGLKREMMMMMNLMTDPHPSPHPRFCS